MAWRKELERGVTGGYVEWRATPRQTKRLDVLIFPGLVEYQDISNKYRDTKTYH